MTKELRFETKCKTKKISLIANILKLGKIKNTKINIFNFFEFYIL